MCDCSTTAELRDALAAAHQELADYRQAVEDDWLTAARLGFVIRKPGRSYGRSLRPVTAPEPGLAQVYVIGGGK